MRRLLAPLVLLLAMLAVPATGHAATIGVSDQQASTFTNPLFAPLKIKAARYITPYDVMSSPNDKAALDAWIGAARAANQRILVAFERSRQPGKERHLPSVSEYRAAITAFKAAYPDVKEISVWNEVNRCQSSSRIAGQPTCRKEQRLASYYKAVRSVFGTRGTRIVALDVLDEQNVNKTINVIRRFKRFAGSTPKILGFHNYSDTNRFSTTRTRRVLAAWRKDVWLTETGGIVKLGRSFPRSTSRAAKALGCMFTMGRSYKRVKRLYVYQFNPAFTAADDFDAGLVNLDGTVRPGYNVVKDRKRRSCRR
jgi:hypothetical protein